MVVVRPSEAAGRKASRGLDRTVISLRRMALGSGYRSWMKSVAVGDPHGSSSGQSGRLCVCQRSAFGSYAGNDGVLLKPG